MMSNAPTNTGKHVTSNIAFARCQLYTDNSFSFLIATNDVVHYDYIVSRI